MVKFTLSATVNYPETKEVETPVYKDRNIEDLTYLLRGLLHTEVDMTSCLITIVKQPED